MKLRSIQQEDFIKILKSDAEVYPTSTPVTTQLFNTWFSKHPEFGMIYTNDKQELLACCIIIPCNKEGFEKLISGKKNESELSVLDIFSVDKHDHIGLHIYHIEKYQKISGSFRDTVLRDLSTILANLRKIKSSLKVIGFSGYCTSKSGINLFYNEWNCREREFLSQEHILVHKETNKCLLVKMNTQKELDKLIQQGYVYSNRCKMLVTYPNELSVVWSYIQAENFDDTSLIE